MTIENYVKTGKIAAEVREMVRVKDWVGKTVYEICEEVENEIRKRGAKCAFPVNASINPAIKIRSRRSNFIKSNQIESIKVCRARCH